MDKLIRDPRTGQWVWANESMLTPAEPASVADIRGLTVRPLNARGLPGISVPEAPQMQEETNWLPRRVVDLPTQTHDPKTGQPYNKYAVGLANFINSMGREWTGFADQPIDYARENPISTALNLASAIPTGGTGTAMRQLGQRFMASRYAPELTKDAWKTSQWAKKELGEGLSVGEMTGNIHALRTEAGSPFAEARNTRFTTAIENWLRSKQQGQKLTNVKGVPDVPVGQEMADVIRPVANYSRKNLLQWKDEIASDLGTLASDISKHLVGLHKSIKTDRKALISEIQKSGIAGVQVGDQTLKPTLSNISANLDAFAATNPKWQARAQDLSQRFENLSQYSSIKPDEIAGDLEKFATVDPRFASELQAIRGVQGEMREVLRNPIAREIASAMDVSGKVLPGLKSLKEVPGMSSTKDLEKVIQQGFESREQFARLVEGIAMNPDKLPEAQSIAGQMFVDQLIKSKDRLAFMRDKKSIMDFAITDKQTHQGLSNLMEVLAKRGRAMDVRNAAMQVDSQKGRFLVSLPGLGLAGAMLMGGSGMGVASSAYAASLAAKGVKLYIENKYLSKLMLDPKGSWMLANIAAMPKTSKNLMTATKGLVSLAGRLGLPLRHLDDGSIEIGGEDVGGKELFSAMESNSPNPAPSQASPKSPSPVR